MKALIAEDDFISRKLLQQILLTLGECDVAMNGREAYEAYITALEQKAPYDLICLDVMMPELDGQSTLKMIREHESSKNILGHDAVKIIMTTGCKDPLTVLGAFKSGCEAYVTKPFDRTKLLAEIEKLKLV